MKEDEMGFWFWPFRRRQRVVSGQPEIDDLDRQDARYEGELRAAIAALPWFGEQVPLRANGRRRRGRALDLAEEQRVFLAWLGGPPSSDVAARAQVGQRTVYNVLHRVIYNEDPVQVVPHWVDLGLIIGLTAPLGRDEIQRDIVCLVCHAHLHHAVRSGPRVEGRRFHLDRLTKGFRGGGAYKLACDVQAHLISHFHLGEDPLQRVGAFNSLTRAMFAESAWSRLPERTASLVPVVPDTRRESEPQRVMRLWRRELLDTRKATSRPSALL